MPPADDWWQVPHTDSIPSPTPPRSRVFADRRHLADVWRRTIAGWKRPEVRRGR